MATSVPGFIYSSIVAGEDQSTQASYLYRAVKQGADAGEEVRVSAVTDHIIGILQNSPEENMPASIMDSGITKWVAGAAVTRGAKVTHDNEGRCVAEALAGNTFEGEALDAAGAAGEVIRVLLGRGQIAD